MSKPHIKKGRYGLWYCAGGEVITIGFKPSDALRNWLRCCE